MAVSFFMSASLGPAAATGAAALLRKYVSLFRAPTKSITRKNSELQNEFGESSQGIVAMMKRKTPAHELPAVCGAGSLPC